MAFGPNHKNVAVTQTNVAPEGVIKLTSGWPRFLAMPAHVEIRFSQLFRWQIFGHPAH